MQELGNAGGDYAAVQQAVEARHDDATVKEATNAIARHYADIGYTGPDAYYNKQGKDALLKRPQVEGSLDALIEQSRSALKTQRQRDMFDSAIVPQRINWGVQIATFADKETRTYDLQASTARAGVAGELAKLTYLDDPEHAEKQIGTALLEIENKGKLEGLPPEAIALEKLKFTSGTYRDIGANIAVQGGLQGPEVARAFVEKHGESMTDDDRRFVNDRADVQQNQIEAEQRRQEAELRRQQREARGDAKDRAKSAADNIDLGIPLSADDYATAHADALASGDEALVKRLEVGQFKNNLTVEWNDAPPADLQARVNELNSDIAKAGGKVKPETVVERDHLQALLGRSNSDLNADPLSWGAKHLGIAPGTLNLRDPGSIKQRIDAATLVARRTGRAPAPLTNEEAATLAPLISNGSVEQKTKLVMQLSQFGPLAVTAARQVAPNNASFQNMVGLAGHRNRGVGASRVNQIIAGQEVLKTKPKLIDNTESVRQFNELTGQSLMFLPSVKTGVLENAKALLANESNERGYSDWGEASGRWYAAINSALGAYTRDGKQIGGLHGFNGGVTVIPEEMSETDFEQRISRATGPQIKGGHNGTPVYADGRAATATEIKKMQWVPIGDGIYRLSPNGRDFLHTREETPNGGFYVINVRKLPGFDSGAFNANLAAHGYVRR